MTLEPLCIGWGRTPLAALAIAAAAVCPTDAQEGSDCVRLPEAEEIAMARSAAPEAVSADATIWVLRDGEYEVAVEGSNGNACMVSRTWPTSLEPICYDPEGARTLLPIEVRLVESRVATGDREAARGAVQAEIESGGLPLPERPSMTYMLSSAQRLVADGGREVGAWRPHFMMYIPYLRSEDLGIFGQTSQIFVAREGEPLAHVITVAPEFIDPEPVEGATSSAATGPWPPAAREELLEMASRDREAREGFGPEAMGDTAFMRRLARTDTVNTRRLLALVDSLGWPGVEDVGTDGLEAAFLLVQHAADLELQKRALPSIEADVRAGHLDPQDYALLVDRTRQKEGLLQLYGTQLSIVSGSKQARLDPIQDSARVDARREALGLPSLARYLDLVEEETGFDVVGHDRAGGDGRR